MGLVNCYLSEYYTSVILPMNPADLVCGIIENSHPIPLSMYDMLLTMHMISVGSFHVTWES